MYFAPNSSKSNDYTDGSTRAMFMCKVAAGKEYVVYNDMRNLQKPPSGYDSVYGEVGQALNYPGKRKETFGLIGFCRVDCV